MTESAVGSACASVIGADEQPDEPEQQPNAEHKDDEAAAGKPKKQKNITPEYCEKITTRTGPKTT